LILHNNPFNFSAFLQYHSSSTCPFYPSSLSLHETGPGNADHEIT
jgi:hypothetical protein